MSNTAIRPRSRFIHKLCVFAHPRLQGLRRFSRVTRDAHRPHARLGFTPLAAPERHRERFQADVYRRPE